MLNVFCLKEKITFTRKVMGHLQIKAICAALIKVEKYPMVQPIFIPHVAVEPSTCHGFLCVVRVRAYKYRSFIHLQRVFPCVSLQPIISPARLLLAVLYTIRSIQTSILYVSEQQIKVEFLSVPNLAPCCLFSCIYTS